MPSEVHGSEPDRSYIKGKLHKIIFILTIDNPMGTLSYTDERAENILFSELPMGEEKFLIETMLKYL